MRQADMQRSWGYLLRGSADIVFRKPTVARVDACRRISWLLTTVLPVVGPRSGAKPDKAVRSASKSQARQAVQKNANEGGACECTGIPSKADCLGRALHWPRSPRT